MKILSKSYINSVLSLLACLFFSNPLSAAGAYPGIHPLLSDQFVIGLGGYYADQDGSYHRDGLFGRGTDIQFDSDLGISDSEWTPNLVMLWRFGEQSQLQLEYFSVDQDNGLSISRDFVLGEGENEIEFSLGANVQINEDLDILRLFYGYSFVKDQNTELGAGVGLHYGAINLALTGNALVNNAPVLNYTSELDDWAVLPNLGIYGAYAFDEKWLIKGRLDWFSASIGEFSGDLWNAGASLQYQITRHFGAGLSYRYLDLNLERDKSGPGDWETDLQFSGPAVFVNFNF